MTTTPRPQQFEFAFAPQVSVDMRVDRLADGRVLLTPSAEVRVWVSTYEAAEMLGKSDWWVRDRLDAGILRGERTGRNWRVDATSVEELKRRSRNF
jgi:excisionase family DNA binding protein